MTLESHLMYRLLRFKSQKRRVKTQFIMIFPLKPGITVLIINQPSYISYPLLSTYIPIFWWSNLPWHDGNIINQHDGSAPASHCSSSISSDPRWISVALKTWYLSQGNDATEEPNIIVYLVIYGLKTTIVYMYSINLYIAITLHHHMILYNINKFYYLAGGLNHLEKYESQMGRIVPIYSMGIPRS